jgi:hypothetical protein
MPVAAHNAARTFGQRLAGERPSRTRAALTAAVAGTAAGVVTYRWLRRDTEAEHD